MNSQQTRVAVSGQSQFSFAVNGKKIHKSFSLLAGLPQFIKNAILDYDLFPTKYALHQNYPNPFNPVTTIRYDLPQSSNVRIVIYNMIGRQVRSLVNRPEEPGYKKAIWDGKNHAGIPVSADIYLYQIQAGEFRQYRKMVLIK